MKDFNAIVKSEFGDYVGYAAEAGAFDGKFESPTLRLERNGWKVLLVEPVPRAFTSLLLNRVNDYCLNLALGSSNEDDVKFYVCNNHSKGASFSSLLLDANLFNAFGVDKDAEEIEEISVNVRTLDYCLETVEFPRLDILSLDVEGYEMEVLQGFRLDLWKPKLLLIENVTGDSNLREYLKDYSFEGMLHHNDLFIRKN